MIRRIAPFLVLAAVALSTACVQGDTRTFEGTDGASLFAQACAECHGAELEGSDQGPPLLHDFYRPNHHADAAFFLAIRRGTRSHHWNFGDMDPIPGLTQPQAEAIVAFVREQQRAAGFE